MCDCVLWLAVSVRQPCGAADALAMCLLLVGASVGGRVWQLCGTAAALVLSRLLVGACVGGPAWQPCGAAAPQWVVRSRRLVGSSVGGRQPCGEMTFVNQDCERIWWHPRFRTLLVQHMISALKASGMTSAIYNIRKLLEYIVVLTSSFIGLGTCLRSIVFAHKQLCKSLGTDHLSDKIVVSSSWESDKVCQMVLGQVPESFRPLHRFPNILDALHDVDRSQVDAIMQ